jgi:nitrite reductase/ring-hydroxylating ferredoxin subunit
MEWIKIFNSVEEAKERLADQKTQLLIVHGQRICLALHNESFYAVQDSCTHSGASLSKGSINYLGEVICPLHNYRFDLLSGRATDSSCADLKTYALRYDGGFFIGI